MKNQKNTVNFTNQKKQLKKEAIEFIKAQNKIYSFFKIENNRINDLNSLSLSEILKIIFNKDLFKNSLESKNIKNQIESFKNSLKEIQNLYQIYENVEEFDEFKKEIEDFENDIKI
ncbi:hypothetical protein [Mycoplasma struthionis]|uniref:Uncharacterized protein n=1 Tax=Mycoplasma struthionis TaxID=538220 RepID=A0A502M8N6_9MOLU|nr:hypothetical protein [Mycoplasma struthionis]TPI01570.1 hypothetical protein FJM01_02290 [Mycoplasma struthionis]